MLCFLASDHIMAMMLEFTVLVCVDRDGLSGERYGH